MVQSDEATEQRRNNVTEGALLRRPVAALLARLLAAWVVLGPSSASPLEARTCLGFSGQGFLGASGAVRREWSGNMTGVGGSGGVRVGRVAAAGHYLKFSGADGYDQEFGFERARVTLAYELPTSSLSLCPTLSTGVEGVSSRDFSSFPYRSKPFFGGGLAVGHPFTATGSGVTLVPSLAASFESHVIERIIEGDISINERATTVVLHGGLTVESGRLFVRPYAAFLAVENGWLIGGATLGLRF